MLINSQNPRTTLKRAQQTRPARSIETSQDKVTLYGSSRNDDKNAFLGAMTMAGGFMGGLVCAGLAGSAATPLAGGALGPIESALGGALLCGALGVGLATTVTALEPGPKENRSLIPSAIIGGVAGGLLGGFFGAFGAGGNPLVAAPVGILATAATTAVLGLTAKAVFPDR